MREIVSQVKNGLKAREDIRDLSWLLDAMSIKLGQRRWGPEAGLLVNELRSLTKMIPLKRKKRPSRPAGEGSDG